MTVLNALDHTYRLIRPLGKGSFGEVHEAQYLPTGERRALKFLLQASREDAERFHREARILAAIRHPHVVGFYEFGTFGSDRLAMSLELVPGGSLEKWTQRRPVGNIALALQLVEDVAGAVHHVHQYGVVHRDLKPHNVLVTTTHDRIVPKVSDFGIARLADASVQLTRAGIAFGTPAYMAPEQLTNEPGQIGPRTDVYGIGAILYELLTGSPPCPGRTAAEAYHHVANVVPTAPDEVRGDLPAGLSAVCMKCLEKNPADRYPTALAVADALAACRRGEGRGSNQGGFGSCFEAAVIAGVGWLGEQLGWNDGE